MLSLNAIGFSFNSTDVDDEEFQQAALFSGISHQFMAQECWQITGANGSGKTTFLRIIAGLITPHRGTVTQCPPLAYLGHALHLKPELNSWQNLHTLLNLYPDAETAEGAIATALQHWGVAKVAHLPTYLLSAGQKRRVLLAWLSLRDCPLWVLDEPFSALDSHGVAQLWTAIHAHLHAKGAVVFCSHHDWTTHPLSRDAVQVLSLHSSEKPTKQAAQNPESAFTTPHTEGAHV